MIITTFPHRIKIDNILNKLPNDTCGTASACIVFEKFGLTLDYNEFIKKARDGISTVEYPVAGSNVFGTALAIASTDLVDVEVYIDFDINNEYGTLDEYEKPIIDELKLLRNITIQPSISIEEINNKLSDECIPIMAFNPNGNPSNGHFSPLRGLNAGKILLFPLDAAGESCDCFIDEFVKTWWTKDSLRPCIFVRKRKN